jgi:hypothetical protein
MEKYESLLPKSFVWTAMDYSNSLLEVQELEDEFGFKLRAVISSLHYLANTAFEELYAICKACRYMHLPSRKNFVAVRHLLHRLRCHPPKAIKYYHDSCHSALYEHLKENYLGHLNPWFIAMSDSSFANDDGQCSTGCNLVLLQGVIVSMGCFVPDPIAQLSAEAKANAQTITFMKVSYIKQIVMDIIFGQPMRRYIVSLLTDNTALIEMAWNEHETKSTKHIKH